MLSFPIPTATLKRYSSNDSYAGVTVLLNTSSAMGVGVVQGSGDATGAEMQALGMG